MPIRIQLDDPNRTDLLRDYFRRLGAEAAVKDDSTLEVAFRADDDADVAAFLRSWTTTNGVGAREVPAPSVAVVAPREVVPRGSTPADPPPTATRKSIWRWPSSTARPAAPTTFSRRGSSSTDAASGHPC